MMNPTLEEIDSLYRSILPYHIHRFLPPEEGSKLLLEADEAFWKGSDEAIRIYNFTHDKFIQLAPTLSPQEIIEGFQQGCILLQANLGGYMYRYFDEMYTQTMIQGVKDNHPGGYLFVAALSRHYGKQIAPLLIEALDCTERRIRENAIGFIHELEIVEAIPKLKELIHDSDSKIAQDARTALEFLERK